MRINPKNLTVALLTAFAPVAAQAQGSDAARHELLPYSNAIQCGSHNDFQGVNFCLATLQTFYSLINPHLSDPAALFVEQADDAGQDVCETIPHSLAQATTRANQAGFNQASLADFQWDVSGALLEISECLSAHAGQPVNGRAYLNTAEMLADIARSMTPQ